MIYNLSRLYKVVTGAFLFLSCINIIITPIAGASVGRDCQDAVARASQLAYSRSIVLLAVPLENDEYYLATGFKVGPNLIATSAHLLKGKTTKQLKATKVLVALTQVTIDSIPNLKSLFLNAAVKNDSAGYISSSRDWAVLRVDRKRSDSQSLEIFDSAWGLPIIENWDPESVVEVVGYSTHCLMGTTLPMSSHRGEIIPLYRYNSLSPLERFDFWVREKVPFVLRLNAPISYGSSGSPIFVFNQEGAALGVIGIFKGQFQVGNHESKKDSLMTPSNRLREGIDALIEPQSN